MRDTERNCRDGVCRFGREPVMNASAHLPVAVDIERDDELMCFAQCDRRLSWFIESWCEIGALL